MINKKEIALIEGLLGILQDWPGYTGSEREVEYALPGGVLGGYSGSCKVFLVRLGEKRGS